MSFDAIVVNRGHLGRSRLSFILEATAQAYGEIKLVWAAPQPLTAKRVGHLQTFLERIPGLSDFEIVVDSFQHGMMPTRGLRSSVRGDLPLVAVGFSCLPLLATAGRRATVFCPRGIPEEQLLHSASARIRLRVAGMWRLLRALPQPPLTVTVSRRMAELFQARTGWSRFEAVPLCVDRTIFKPAAGGVRMVYQGTGAPWQGINHLAEVWGALGGLLPSVEFRVISRDPRTAPLIEAVGSDRCDTVTADYPQEVARALEDCRIGFVLRTNSLVNRVAFPIKVGEYLATGVSVVTTDLDWDVGDLIREADCGTLVPPDAGPVAIAQAVKKLHTQEIAEAAHGCERGANALDRTRWMAHLADRMPGARRGA